MILDRDDVLELAKADIELKDTISRIKAKFNIKGYKYDFYYPYTKDTTPARTVQASTLIKKPTHSSTAKGSSLSNKNSNWGSGKHKYLRKPTIISDFKNMFSDN